MTNVEGPDKANVPAGGSSSGEGERTPRREDWIDAGRGFCVLAVVLYHVCIWQYPAISGAEPEVQAGWLAVNSWLSSLRLPLLLALSGMLASRRIRAGWRRGGGAVRAVSSYYLYAVWLAVYWLVSIAFGNALLPHSIDSPGEFARQLLLPDTPLWYVFALAIYVPLLILVRALPSWVVLTALATVCVVVRTIPTVYQFPKVAEYAVFFAIGVYGSAMLRTFAAKVRFVGAVMLSAACVTVVLLTRHSRGVFVDAIVHILSGGLFIATGIAVMAFMVRWAPLARAAQSVGRRTLPIYVLHSPIILAVMAVAVPGPEDPGVQHFVALVWPLGLTVAIVAGAVAISRFLVWARLGALFAPPELLLSRLRNRAAPPSVRQPKIPGATETPRRGRHRLAGTTIGHPARYRRTK